MAAAGDVARSVRDAASLTLMAAVVGAGHTLFQVFSSFVQPLVWALVLGAALYKLKTVLVEAIEKWLNSLDPIPEDTKHPTETVAETPTPASSRPGTPVDGNSAQVEVLTNVDIGSRPPRSSVVLKPNAMRPESAALTHTPLPLGLATLPLVLLGFVAHNSTELLYTCKESRRRVAGSIGALLALHFRGQVLPLVQAVVQQTESAFAIALNVVGRYQSSETWLLLPLLLSAAIVYIAMVKGLTVHPVLAEKASAGVAALGTVLGMCRYSYGIAVLGGFGAMVFGGYLLELSLTASRGDENGGHGPETETTAGTLMYIGLGVGRDGQDHGDSIWPRKNTEAIESRILGLRVKKYLLKVSKQAPGWALYTVTAYLRGNFGNNSAKKQSKYVNIKVAVTLDFRTIKKLRDHGYVLGLIRSDGSSKYYFDRLNDVDVADDTEDGTGEAIIRQQLTGARNEKCAWPVLLAKSKHVSLPTWYRDAQQRYHVQRCDIASGTMKLYATLNPALKGKDDDKDLSRRINSSVPTYKLPTNYLERGWAIFLKVNSQPEATCYNGLCELEPIIEFASKDLGRWYHMDLHFFSLLVSCLCYKLGLFWCALIGFIILITVVCQRLAEHSTIQNKVKLVLRETKVKVVGLLPEWAKLLTLRLYELYMRADKRIIDFARQSVHSAVSFVLILGLMLASLAVCATLAVHVHRESSAIVSSTGTYAVDLVNRSATLQEYLPSGAEAAALIESGANQSYAYARTYIQHRGEEYFGPTFNMTDVEMGIERIWHGLNQTNMSASTSTSTSSSAVATGGGDLVTLVQLMLAGEMTEAYTYSTFVLGGDTLSKFDLSSFSAYLSQVWGVLRLNLEQAFNIIASVLSIVVSQSMVAVNFALELATFFTAFFYLLSSDDNEYKPIQILKGILPDFLKERAVHAVYRTIDGIFVITIKMGLFHSLFMWLTLKLFGAGEVIVIPCLIAGVISVVPIMPSFMVAVPHTIAIWLSPDENAGFGDAMIFFSLHFYVYWIVSPSIYESMNFNLPYFIVSMSVVGGMVLSGPIGALQGPLVLASFYTMFKLVLLATEVDWSRDSSGFVAHRKIERRGTF